MLRSVVALFTFYQAYLVIASETCVFNSRHQWELNIDYEYDCRSQQILNDELNLAICIAQRNTLKGVFQCANLNPNKVMYWNVDTGSPIDSMDMIPPDTLEFATTQHSIKEFDNDSDGQLELTPRGLLLQVSRLPQCQHCEMTSPIYYCPQHKWDDFLACLCCECVTQANIQCLEACIFDEDDNKNFAKKKDFHHMKSQDSVCINNSWKCDFHSYRQHTSPNCPTRNNKKQDKRIAAYSESGSIRYASTSCSSSVFVVSDGYRTSRCADSSDSDIHTPVSTTMPWSKASVLTAATSASPLISMAVQQATTTMSDDGAAAQTLNFVSSSPTSANRSSSVKKSILTVPSLIAIGLALEVFFLLL